MKTKTLTIPQDLLDRMNQEVGGIHRLGVKATFTTEQDALILAGFTAGRKSQFARWFKKEFGFGSKETLARRHLELVGQGYTIHGS